MDLLNIAIKKTRMVWLHAWLLFGLFVVLPANAQIKIGDLTAGMDGTLGVGYGADAGGASGHAVTLSGVGNISGSFYDPRFLSFWATPSYNRSQSNSGGEAGGVGGGSLTNASSVGAGFGIFGGSHFPGNVSLNKTYNSSGSFGVPGTQGFITDGNTTQFSIGWNELVPKMPPVSVSYTQSSSTSSIFGTSQNDNSSARTFTLQSNYRLDGWPMSGHFTDVNLKTETPSFLTPGVMIAGDDSSMNFVFSTSHKLPMTGDIGLSYGYDNYNGTNGGISQGGGSGSNISAVASFMPLSRLSTQFQFQYNSSLAAQVESQVVSAGGVAPHLNLGAGSHTLQFSNSDTVYFRFNLNAGFNIQRTEQEAYGVSVSADHYSGVLNYHFQKPLWGTVLLYAGVNDEAADGANQGAGLTTGANINKKLKGWKLSAGVSYQQGVQTMVAAVTTSNYSFLANVSRDLTRRLKWYGNVNGFHSGFSLVQGTSSHSEGVSTSLLYRTFAVAANYSESSGAALIGQGGLITAPTGLPTSLLGPSQYLLTTGKSYGLSGSGAFLTSKLILSGAYNHSLFSTSATGVNSADASSTMWMNASYSYRKMGFTAGYTRLTQGVGVLSATSLSYASYYVGIQRWFKVF